MGISVESDPLDRIPLRDWLLTLWLAAYALFPQPVLGKICLQALLSLNIPKMQLEINQNASTILDVLRALLTVQPQPLYFSWIILESRLKRLNFILE